MNTLASKPSPSQNEPAPWNFCAHQGGIRFTWQEDPSWHCLYLKADNQSPSIVNYSYEYEIYEADRLADQGKHYWTRLKMKQANKIKVNKNFRGVTRVVLKNLKVERY